MASTNLQAENEAMVCDVEMLPSSPVLSLPLIVEEALIRAEEEEDYMTRSHHDTDVILDQAFVVPFPDPASTLHIHGSARSHQGVQGSCSLPSTSEQMSLRAVNHSEVVHENGVQSPPPNISSSLNTSLPMLQNPPRHLFTDPYEYELEKIRIEEENLKKSVEETTSLLMAELDRKMAEARSEFDRESQEFDAACKEVETRMGLVRTGSLLANAFVSKCSERSASNDLAAVRAVISQHSTQQQQAVQTNTHMNSTAPPRVRPQQEVQARTHTSTSAPLRVRPQQGVQASTQMITSVPPRVRPQQEVQGRTHMSTSAPPRPSVIAVDDDPVPNSSRPLPHLLPRRTMTQPNQMSQQTVQAHTHVNSTAPPPPSVAAVEPQTPNHLRPLVRFPRPTTTQPSPMSQQAVAQSNTTVNSTALPRPSVTSSEALPLHSPLSNTPRPRPRPVISNMTPSSSPHVHATVRGPAPHLVRAAPPHMARRPPPHLRQYGASPTSMSAAAAVTTQPRRSVQEQEQQQGKDSNGGGLVHLSDED